MSPHGKAGMKLESDHPLCKGFWVMLGEIHGDLAVDEVKDSVSDGDDAEFVPIGVGELFIISDGVGDFFGAIGFSDEALSALGDDATFGKSLAVEHAEVFWL